VPDTSLMTSEIILQPGPNAADLVEKRERLAAVRAALAEREADEPGASALQAGFGVVVRAW